MAIFRIDWRNFISSDTDTAAEYTPTNIKYDAKPINDMVASPNGGYGTSSKPIGWFEVNNSIIPYMSYPTIKNDNDLRRCATAGDQYGAIEVTLDGRKIQNLEQYRVQTEFFNVNITKDNLYSYHPGIYKAYADGWMVLLEPLPPGKHDLHIKASVFNPIETQYNYSAEWTYHLNIVKT